LKKKIYFFNFFIYLSNYHQRDTNITQQALKDLNQYLVQNYITEIVKFNASTIKKSPIDNEVFNSGGLCFISVVFLGFK
jgi:hypothetical protein